MEGSMEQPYFHRLHRITCQRSVVHCLIKSFLNGGNKFPWNHPTHNTVDKVQTCFDFIGLWIRIFWSQFKYNIRKFTFTTSLFLINLFVLHIGKQSFLISNLGSTLVDLHLKFSFQSINDNLQVKFAHPSENNLTGLMVGIDM